jgi:hypothetical protein
MNSISSFIDFLENFRHISFSERDKGDRFERLMGLYLQVRTQSKYDARSSYMEQFKEAIN